MRTALKLALLGAVAPALLLSNHGTAQAQVIDPVALIVSAELNTFFTTHAAYKGTSMMVVVSAGNGSRTSALGYNAQPTDLFAIGSNTKPFTAMLAALQDEDGGMTLDSDLANWVSDTTCTTHTVCVDPGICIPERTCTQPRATSTTITLRDLADHYSGLPKNPPHADETNKAGLYSDVFTQGAQGFGEGDQTPEATQNEGTYNYSNWGFGVLGDVLADYHYGLIGNEAGASRWPSLLAARITGPLGMTHTVPTTSSGNPPAGAIQGLACTGSNPATCSPSNGHLWCYDDNPGLAAGGLWMDGVDMGTWLNVNLGNFSAVTTPSEIQTAVKSYLHVYEHPGSNHGLAWTFDRSGTIQSTTGSAMTAMWKGGDSPGFHSYVMLLPGDINAGAENRAVAIMVNFDTNSAQPALLTQVDAIAQRVLQDLVNYGI